MLSNITDTGKKFNIYLYILIHLAVKASYKQSLTAHKSLTQKRLSIVQQADADIFWFLSKV